MRRELWRWIRRSRPTLVSIARTSALGVVTSLFTLLLGIGAPVLLVVAATRPAWRVIGIGLVVVEVAAFLRSPLRWAERTSAHGVAIDAVSRWRRYVLLRVGWWQWRDRAQQSATELARHTLLDTESLQDLWIRAVFPLVSAVGGLLVASVLVGILAAQSAVTLSLAATCAAVALTLAWSLWQLPVSVRHARAVQETSLACDTIVRESAQVVAEWRALGDDAWLHTEVREASAALARAERASNRAEQWERAAGVVSTACALSGVWGLGATSLTWRAICVLLALSVFEIHVLARDAATACAEVLIATDRLNATLHERGRRSEGDKLSLQGIRVRIGERLVTVPDMTLTRGSRLALTGASGSGKSTLLRLLAGLDTPEAGVITFGDVPVSDLDDDARPVVWVPSEPGLWWPHVTDAISQGRATRRDYAADTRTLHIEHVTSFASASRGERLRAGVVRALATSPAVVLLDEPTSGLDHDATTAVLALLAEAHCTVIIATHDPLVVTWCQSELPLE